MRVATPASIASRAAPALSRWRQPLERRAVVLVSIAILLASAVLLFTRLGHNALWDDEALTAIPASNIFHFGDAIDMYRGNLTATRFGAELKHGKFRYMPPLQYYWVAPFVGLLGDSAFSARLPFAICGLGVVGLMLRWLIVARASRLAWLAFAAILLGNVSFFLYARQCRYYELVVLLSVAVAMLYLRGKRTNGAVLAIAGLLVLLLASNTMAYVAIVACLLCDYFLFEFRDAKRPRFTGTQWLLLIVPQIALGAAILSVWNPFGSHTYDYQPRNWFLDKAILFWWNLRDMAGNEFVISALFLAGAVYAILPGHRWIRRAMVAFLLYTALIALTSPQPVGETGAADVRYLVGLLPLAIAIATLVVVEIGKRSAGLAVALALVGGLSNLLTFNYASLEPVDPIDTVLHPPVHSSLFDYLHELADPPHDPLGMTARALGKLPAGSKIVVAPNADAYPLIFAAPQHIYGWQLWKPTDPALQHLDPFMYYGQVPPRYFVFFGQRLKPELDQRLRRLAEKGYQLSEVELLPVFGKDRFRPELMWHQFYEPGAFDTRRLAVYIYQVFPPGQAPPADRGF